MANFSKTSHRSIFVDSAESSSQSDTLVASAETSEQSTLVASAKVSDQSSLQSSILDDSSIENTNILSRKCLICKVNFERSHFYSHITIDHKDFIMSLVVKNRSRLLFEDESPSCNIEGPANEALSKFQHHFRKAFNIATDIFQHSEMKNKRNIAKIKELEKEINRLQIKIPERAEKIDGKLHECQANMIREITCMKLDVDWFDTFIQVGLKAMKHQLEAMKTISEKSDSE